jgi:hypothetical protein
MTTAASNTTDSAMTATLNFEIRFTRPNAAHQWRAADDARYETEAQSARPLNAHCWVLCS